MLKQSIEKQLHALLNLIRKPLRARQIKHTARTVTREEIAADLRALGIETGDAVFLHSSLKSLGYVPGGASTVLQALIDVLGPTGTLVVPTYYLPGGTIHNAVRTPDYVFDPREHGSNLGALPATILQLPGVVRGIHPTHSVSAIGRQAEYIVGDQHRAPSIFGTGSPWDRFHEVNGKVLGLGISMGPVTFYHLLEDRLGPDFPLPVREPETFQMPCRTADGDAVTVPVVPLDPQFLPRRIDNPARKDLREYFWREFERAGLLTVGKVGEGRAWYIPAGDFYDHLVALCAEGITIYATPEELARRPIVP